MKAAAGAAGRAATPSDTGGRNAPASARQTMRAIVQDTYGVADVWRAEETARPAIGDGEVLVRVRRQLRALALSPFTRQRLTTFVSRHRLADLETLAQLIEAGRLTPVIGKTYPLHQAPDAMRDLRARHARGKLVITVTDAG